MYFWNNIKTFLLIIIQILVKTNNKVLLKINNFLNFSVLIFSESVVFTLNTIWTRIQIKKVFTKQTKLLKISNNKTVFTFILINCCFNTLLLQHFFYDLLCLK